MSINIVLYLLIYVTENENQEGRRKRIQKEIKALHKQMESTKNVDGEGSPFLKHYITFKTYLPDAGDKDEGDQPESEEEIGHFGLLSSSVICLFSQ